jgi:hypothetical protein
MWKKFESHMTPIMVVIAFALGIGYAVMIIILNAHGMTVSDTLTEKFYDVIVGELLALAFIKGTKHIGEHFGSSKIAESEDNEDE